MIKRSISALIIVLISFFVLVGVPQVQARSVSPQSHPCTVGCWSNTYWNGRTYGGKLTTTVTGGDMHFYFAPQSDWFVRQMVLYWSTSQNNPQASIGEVIAGTGNNSQICGSNGAGTAEYYANYTDGAGNSNTQCFSVPSADYNLTVIYKINNVYSGPLCGGSGLLFEIWGDSGDYHHWCETSSTVAYYNREKIQTGISDYVCYGNNGCHEVYGVDNTHISWENSVGTYSEQGRDPDFIFAADPPQLYFFNPPGPNGSGDLYDCVYDSPDLTCILNG